MCFCGFTTSHSSTFMFVEIVVLVSTEQRFFLSTEIGVSLREGCMACGLSIFVIQGPGSALATGFHHVVTVSTHMPEFVQSQSNHCRVTLCYVVLSLLVGPSVTLTSSGLVINGLVYQDPDILGGCCHCVCVCVVCAV